jgi:hypothetical protein
MTDSRQLFSLGILSVMLSLTACAVGPDYVRPPMPTPAAYKEVEGWKAAEPKDHLARGKWREIFGDSQLNALEAGVHLFTTTSRGSITYWTSREIPVFGELLPGDYTNLPVRKGEGHAYRQSFQQLP